jgi:hypothetical protein
MYVKAVSEYLTLELLFGELVFCGSVIRMSCGVIYDPDGFEGEVPAVLAAQMYGGKSWKDHVWTLSEPVRKLILVDVQRVYKKDPENWINEGKYLTEEKHLEVLEREVNTRVMKIGDCSMRELMKRDIDTAVKVRVVRDMPESRKVTDNSVWTVPADVMATLQWQYVSLKLLYQTSKEGPPTDEVSRYLQDPSQWEFEGPDAALWHQRIAERADERLLQLLRERVNKNVWLAVLWLPRGEGIWQKIKACQETSTWKVPNNSEARQTADLYQHLLFDWAVP